MKKIRLIAFIWIVSNPAFAQINFSYSFVAESFVDISLSAPQNMYKGEYFYTGEKIIIQFSKEVRKNWWEEEKENCFIGFLHLFCDKYKIVHNNFTNSNSLPPKIYIRNSENEDLLGPLTTKGETAYTIQLPNNGSNFSTPYSLFSVIDDGTIDRAHSDGKFSVKVIIDATPRLAQFKIFLKEKGNSLHAADIKDQNVLDKHFTNQKPKEIAQCILDDLKVFDKIEEGEKQQILELASFWDPNNQGIQLELSKTYLNSLDFATAEKKLQEALTLLKSKPLNNEENFATAYHLLGKTFENKKISLDKEDLLKAINFYSQSAQYYKKAKKYPEMVEEIQYQARALRKINTTQTLLKASQLLSENEIYLCPLSVYKYINKFGYIGHYGNIMIPAKYDSVGNFKNNFAPVKVAGKWGYIDRSGSYIVTPKYEKAFQFDSDRALVQKNNLFFYIDANGKEINTIGFMNATSFEKNLAYVQKVDSSFWYINKKGELFAEIDRFNVGFEYKKGANPRKYILNSITFKEGMPYGVYLKNRARSKNDKRFYGLVDSEYNVVNEATHADIEFSSNKMIYIVKDYQPDSELFTVLFWDKDLSEITIEKLSPSDKMLYLWDFVFKENDKYGIWELKKGHLNIKLKPIYDEIFSYENGLAIVKQGNTFGIINENGKFIYTSPNQNKQSIQKSIIDKNTGEALFLISDLDKYGVINESGKIIVPFNKDNINFIDNSTTDFEIKNPSNKYLDGIYRRDVGIIIPTEYRNVDKINDSLFLVTYNNSNRKVAVINIDKKELVPKMQYIDVINDSIYIVQDTMSRYGILKLNGDTVLPFNYSSIVEIETDFLSLPTTEKSNINSTFRADGSVFFEITDFSEKTGLANENGQILIPVKYAGIVKHNGIYAAGNVEIINNKETALYSLYLPNLQEPLKDSLIVIEAISRSENYNILIYQNLNFEICNINGDKLITGKAEGILETEDGDYDITKVIYKNVTTCSKAYPIAKLGDIKSIKELSGQVLLIKNNYSYILDYNKLQTEKLQLDDIIE